MAERKSHTFRIAAIGDLHVRGSVPSYLDEQIDKLDSLADVLVLTGDITNFGRLAQAQRAAETLKLARIPMIAVLGNHDRRTIRRRRFRDVLENAGVTFIDGGTFVLGGDRKLGFAGVEGSGGGFWPDEGPDTLPRRACQRLAVRARLQAGRLDDALSQLDTELKVVVTHFAPTISTLGNEPFFKHWMLGNVELARVIDRHCVDLVLHGHAHHGNPFGETLGGTPVRNVAIDVAGGIVIHELTSNRRPKRAVCEPGARVHL